MSLRLIKKRVEFARLQLSSGIDWEKAVIISDESRFKLHDDSRRVWVKRGVYNPGTFRGKEKFSKGIMVWGAIGHGWRSPLIIIRGRLNSEGYIDLLKENSIIEKLNRLFGEKNFHFQQDGASPHRAKATTAYLNPKVNMIEDWPPNSPDCSCIENLWGILKRRVAERDPQSIDDLIKVLQDEWSAIDQQVIDKLLASTPERFRLVLEEEGKSINHRLKDISKRQSESCALITSSTTSSPI